MQSNYELSVFLSLVIGHCGNCGGQSVANIVRLCKEEKVTVSNILKETLYSTLSTSLLIIFFILFGSVLHFSRNVIMVASLTLLVVAPSASFIASFVCKISQSMNRDPAIYAGPIMTTVVDLLGIVTYIGLANYFISN